MTYSVLEEIEDIGFSQGRYKPHKHIALLTAIRLLKLKPENSHRIYYDTEFREIFSDIFIKYRSGDDRDRPYTPFFHLKSTSFWKLIPRQGKERELLSIGNIGGPGRLMEVVSHAEVSEEFFSAAMDSNMCHQIESVIINCLENRNSEFQTPYTEFERFERIAVEIETNTTSNPFVGYLNRLHSRDAGNENALAESQACDPDFSRICVRHPLVDIIAERLTEGSGQSVLLTGHAGDGKSTLALTLYKMLKGRDENLPLPHPLRPREDILLPNGVHLAIIKDLSEWRTEQRDALLTEVREKKTRVLLVTNTGALLDTFCGYAERKGLGSRAEWEPRILRAMDAESDELNYDSTQFAFFNLALRDNLNMARQIFGRMLAPENWNPCENKSCREHCPIYRNVELLKANSDLAARRLFLAYRRMYEYGTRLTIQQLTAHLAYLITAGMEYADIRQLAERVDKPLMSEFLFYNRFFGDNGHDLDQAAARMPVIREIRAQGFGERPCPATERHLWLLTHGHDFTLGVPLVEGEFRSLRRYGAQNYEQDDGLTPDQAREQVRRMLYFLHEFSDASQGESFLRQFLGSLAILKWVRWQDEVARLSLDEADNFKKRVFHVLQEQFTGVRLPEIGAAGQDHLYITLSRRRNEIRQSAQVVLVQIDYSNEFKMGLSACGQAEQRRDLILTGHGRLIGIRLTLTLPFLDYVLARHQGEIGNTLQAAYADRLERLKAELIQHCRGGEEDDMLLVRLRTNHTFLRQHYAIIGGKLEVSNA
jgi:energy-coupling factor transporter ATP-binding protein EcfA2